MSLQRRSFRIAFGASAMVLALSLMSQGASAQEAPASDLPSDEPTAAEDGATIIVTGSRIASGFDRPTPVTVIGAERLAERAAPNIGEALNELPSFRGTQTPASSGLGGAAGGYIGGRILDLRGLGAVRTLTLLDGKRFIPSTTEATVDTNMIPSILLSRVEVVTGGASAVYGSDAVSGVVNLILDKRVDGIRANGQYGVSEYGDNATTQFGLAGGWALGDNVHLVLGGEYERNTGVDGCPERDWCAFGQINLGRNPGVTSIPANNLLSGVYPWTADYEGVTTPPASAYVGRLAPVLRPIDGITFSPNGVPRRYQLGSIANNLFSAGGESDGPGENVYFDFPIVSPTQRIAAAGHLTFEATPALTLELGFNYGHGEGDHRAVAYRNTAITIQSTNPFIPRSTDPTLDIPTLLAVSGATSFTLGKGFDDVGPGQVHVANDVYRIVASAEYDLGNSWRADAYYQYGRNDFRRDLTNGTITTRILRAVDAVRLPSGAIVCRVNGDTIATNDDPACVPLNPFGYAQGATFAAAADYVTENGFQENSTTEHVAAANITGTVFELPAGPLGIAAGVEFRTDTIVGAVDANSAARAFFNTGGSVIAGKIEVFEGYAEAEVPLLSDMAFFDELSVNGAMRRTQYTRSSPTTPSSEVSATTWKVGAVWAPIPAIRFRATRSRDIRAPNIAELFGPLTPGSGIVSDPGPPGTPAGGGPGNSVVPLTLGSNANLVPETANTLTLGLVLQPDAGFLGRFSASADYFDIQIEDAISTLGQQNIVTRCYQGDPQSCSLITRNGAGIITNVVDTFQNVNQLIARGVDLELSYRQPLGDSSALDLRVLATHYKDLITVDAVGPTERAGQTGLRGGTPPGIPDWTADVTASLELGNRFEFNTHVRWVNSGFYNAAFVGPEQEGYAIAAPNSASSNAVPSRTYVDILARYKLAVPGSDSEAVVYGGVDNLFNTDPPRVPGANGSGNNVLFNPVGRMFKVGFRLLY
jgi:outer membrane receptor protein involved in Fe transport